MPEASRTLSRVGTPPGLACASTVVGAAKSAETAEARKSFFIAGPFSWWKDGLGSAQPMPVFFLFPINGLSDRGSGTTKSPALAWGATKSLCTIPVRSANPGAAALTPRARLDRRRELDDPDPYTRRPEREDQRFPCRKSRQGRAKEPAGAAFGGVRQARPGDARGIRDPGQGARPHPGKTLRAGNPRRRTRGEARTEITRDVSRGAPQPCALGA